MLEGRPERSEVVRKRVVGDVNLEAMIAEAHTSCVPGLWGMEVGDYDCHSQRITTTVITYPLVISGHHISDANFEVKWPNSTLGR